MDDNTNTEVSRLSAQARLHVSRAATHHNRDEVAELADNAWAAAEAIICAVAITRGWAHASRSDLHAVVSNVCEETGDEKFFTLMTGPSLLRWHSDDGCLAPVEIALYLESTTEFVTKMRALLE